MNKCHKLETCEATDGQTECSKEQVEDSVPWQKVADGVEIKIKRLTFDLCSIHELFTPTADFPTSQRQNFVQEKGGGPKQNESVYLGEKRGANHCCANCANPEYFIETKQHGAFRMAMIKNFIKKTSHMDFTPYTTTNSSE